MHSTVNDNRVAGLDYLRALAITLVFLFHYRLFEHPKWVDRIFSFGWTGVDLFFVLSGYLIASHVFADIHRKRFSLKAFYIKRALRILPAYWVVLTIYFTIPAFREWESLPPLWKFLTFTQNFGLDLRTGKTFSHAWSLCIEEQFYFLLPLAALLFSRFRSSKPAIVLVAVLFAAGFTARLFSWYMLIEPVSGTNDFGFTWYKWMYYPTYNRLDGLLVGITIAGMFHLKPDTMNALQKRVNLLVVIGLALLTAGYFLCIEQLSFHASIFGYPIIAFGLGVLTLTAINPRSLVNKYRLWLVSKIATLSYALYLVHKATNHIAQEQFANLGIAKDGNLMFLLCIISAMVGAAVLYYIIERPFLRIKEALLHRSTSTQKPEQEKVYVQKQQKILQK